MSRAMFYFRTTRAPYYWKRTVRKVLPRIPVHLIYVTYLTIEYCPTDEMLGDFMTKPLQGSKFSFFKSRLMGTDEWVPVTRKKRNGRSALEKIHSARTPGTSSVELQY